MKTKKIALMVFALTALLSCGKESEADKIGDAQICLDKLENPTVAEANACIAMVDGLDSPGASGIRCSGAFIREGVVSGNRLVAAMDSIKDGAGSSNMQKMMGLLSFTSAGIIGTDFANTKTAFDDCYASGGRGSTLLSSFGYFTLSLLNFFDAKNACNVAPVTQDGYTYYDFQACTTSPDDAMNAAMALLALGDPNTGDAEASGVQTGIGTVVVATYRASCVGSQANKDLCGVMKSAIDEAGGETNVRQVAIEFIDKLLNN